MSRDTYYPQAYQRTDGVIEKHYVWSSQLKKAKHIAKNGEKLGFKQVYYEPDVAAPGIKTMTKNAIVMDRRKRSHEHFKKEILPKFKDGSIEQRHFAKKGIVKK